MASEKQVNILMQLLDEALGEVDTIEGKLSSYEEMLQSVKEQMDQISQSNRLIQISNTNNGKLLDEIQFLVVRNMLYLNSANTELSSTLKASADFKTVSRGCKKHYFVVHKPV